MRIELLAEIQASMIFGTTMAFAENLLHKPWFSSMNV